MTNTAARVTARENDQLAKPGRSDRSRLKRNTADRKRSRALTRYKERHTELAGNQATVSALRKPYWLGTSHSSQPPCRTMAAGPTRAPQCAYAAGATDCSR